ncbi:hypothetical protein ACFT5B_07350 [Luteimicrobium sp. NPDC057192]|uniref:hypothetical protein n=1 Tax=Luteimicrobium sp. NPDC057192 TaxID=3346042 RepID=UPI00363D8BC0
MQLATLLRRAGVWARGPAGRGEPDARPAPPYARSPEHSLPDDPSARRVVDPLGRRAARSADVAPAPWPVLLGPEAVPAVQVDGTTCGAAVLVLLAADGDPAVAAWLEHGPVGTSAASRFAALQRAVQRRTTRTALLGVPWPRALGTPPWAAARAARWGSARYGHRVVDDTDPDDLARVRACVDESLSAGVPVPLYTGGDTAGGLAAAVPRHVVLALPGGPAGTVLVYEPGSGAVHQVLADELWSGDRPLAALGRWTHVVWALLPRP